MPQFDVHRMSRGGGLVIDCQSDLHDELDSRFVIPLVPQKTAPPRLGRLHPSVEVGGSHYVLATHLGTAVRKRDLGAPIASLAERRLEIVGAIDALIGGV